MFMRQAFIIGHNAKGIVAARTQVSSTLYLEYHDPRYVI